jgi:hypothetical protein
MSKNDIITPILIEKNGKKYKFVYINFSSDGSIYVIFPRKRGYRISAYNDLKNLKPGYNSLYINNTSEIYINPHISYHPIANAIHITCDGRTIFKKNMSIINFSESTDKVAFPFVQIIYENDVVFLDEYNNKYINPISLKTDYSNRRSLSIELWVHEKNSYIDPNDLPLSKIRGKVDAFKFNHPNINKYTVSLFISQLNENTNPTNQDKRIAMYVCNNETPYAFMLTPE